MSLLEREKKNEFRRFFQLKNLKLKTVQGPHYNFSQKKKINLILIEKNCVFYFFFLQRANYLITYVSYFLSK